MTGSFYRSSHCIFPSTYTFLPATYPVPPCNPPPFCLLNAYTYEIQLASLLQNFHCFTLQLSRPLPLLCYTFFWRTNNTLLYEFVSLPHLALLDCNLLPVRELRFTSASPKHSSGPVHRRCSADVCCMNELMKCLGKKEKFRSLEKYLRRKEFQAFSLFQYFPLSVSSPSQFVIFISPVLIVATVLIVESADP